MLASSLCLTIIEIVTRILLILIIAETTESIIETAIVKNDICSIWSYIVTTLRTLILDMIARLKLAISLLLTLFSPANLLRKSGNYWLECLVVLMWSAVCRKPCTEKCLHLVTEFFYALEVIAFESISYHFDTDNSVFVEILYRLFTYLTRFTRSSRFCLTHARSR